MQPSLPACPTRSNRLVPLSALEIIDKGVPITANFNGRRNTPTALAGTSTTYLVLERQVTLVEAKATELQSKQNDFNFASHRLRARLFALTGNQGNHGEYVKEHYFYLDAMPVASYAKFLSAPILSSRSPRINLFRSAS